MKVCEKPIRRISIVGMNTNGVSGTYFVDMKFVDMRYIGET